MQRLTKREAAVLCELLLKVKKQLSADQVEGISKGVGDELMSEQLRVLDKAVAIIVTGSPLLDDVP